MATAEGIISDIRSSIMARLENDGYLMRGDLIEIFDSHRMDWRNIAGDTEATFTISGIRLSQLPKPHITIDHTSQTVLRFNYPSGDIEQTMTIRGFA